MMLRVIERRIRALHARTRAIRGINLRIPEADGYSTDLRELEGRNGLPQPVKRNFDTLRGSVIEHDHEFFAAEPEQLIGASKALLHELRGQQQHFIPEQVPIGVVDALELVYVHQPQPARVFCAAADVRHPQALPKPFERRLIGLAVQHAGQGIELAVIEQSQMVFQNPQDGVDVIDDARTEPGTDLDDQQTHDVVLRLDRQDHMNDALARTVLHDLSPAHARLPLWILAKLPESRWIVVADARRLFLAAREFGVIQEPGHTVVLDGAVDGDRVRVQKVQQQLHDGVVDAVPITVHRGFCDRIEYHFIHSGWSLGVLRVAAAPYTFRNYRMPWRELKPGRCAIGGFHDRIPGPFASRVLREPRKYRSGAANGEFARKIALLNWRREAAGSRLHREGTRADPPRGSSELPFTAIPPRGYLRPRALSRAPLARRYLCRRIVQPPGPHLTHGNSGISAKRAPRRLDPLQIPEGALGRTREGRSSPPIVSGYRAAGAASTRGPARHPGPGRPGDRQRRGARRTNPAARELGVSEPVGKTDHGAAAGGAPSRPSAGAMHGRILRLAADECGRERRRAAPAAA